MSVFRDEMVNLMPDDEDARRLKKQTFFFAEFLTEQRHPRSLPKLGGKAAVHGHCHHKSLKGGMDDERSCSRRLAWTCRSCRRAARPGRFVRVRARREISRVAGDR